MNYYYFYKNNESGQKIEYKKITRTLKGSHTYFNSLKPLNVEKLVIYDDDFRIIKSVYGYYNIYEYFRIVLK